ERILKEIPPEAPVTSTILTTWESLLETLRQQVRPDDLVVVLSGRRGSVSWHPKLERLPEVLARLLPESFLMIYPSEADAAPFDAGVWLLPSALAPNRLVMDLPAGDLGDALRRLLEREFGHRNPRVREIAGK